MSEPTNISEAKNLKYLRGCPYSNLRQAFLNNVNWQTCFRELLECFEDASQKKAEKFMIKVLAKEWSIEELKKMMQ